MRFGTRGATKVNRATVGHHGAPVVVPSAPSAATPSRRHPDSGLRLDARPSHQPPTPCRCIPSRPAIMQKPLETDNVVGFEGFLHDCRTRRDAPAGRRGLVGRPRVQAEAAIGMAARWGRCGRCAGHNDGRAMVSYRCPIHFCRTSCAKAHIKQTAPFPHTFLRTGKTAHRQKCSGSESQPADSDRYGILCARLQSASS